MPESLSIQVGGNVDGSIVIGDHNFVVNTNHGTVIYQQAGPQVRARQLAPQPPRAPRGFVNRVAELAQLETWIAANEIVLLHAPDGMGKSALLKQAANSAAAKAMPGGVILLESVDVDGRALGPDDIIQRLFDALFESNPPLKVDAVSARTYLSNTRPLVIMDEVGLSLALQKALPDLFPQGAILLSADAPFGADFQRLPLKPLPRAESVALLAAKAELTLNDVNRATIDELCALLDDVSLALVITANVLRETQATPEVALQAIGQIPVSERDPILVALNRAFVFAFNQLSPEEQKVLSAAALTPGVSMTPEWLSAALGGVDVDAFIERLKVLGLLFTNSPRLRLPPGFQAPARRAAVLDEKVVLPRLIEFLGQSQNAEHIQAELGNFFGALAWAAQSGRPADVIALGRAIDPYLTLHGLWDAWSVTMAHILEAARTPRAVRGASSGERAVEAWALHQSGVRAFGAGTREQALDFFRQALELRRSLGDTVGMAYTQHNIDLLIGPPPPPSDTLKTKKPPKPPAKGGPNWPVLIGGIGLVVMMIFAALVVVAGILIFPPATPTPTATITATTASPTDTLEPVVPPTQTSTPTLTPPPDLTPTPTVTLVPTPLGGSGEIVFQAISDSPLLVNFFSMYLMSVDGSDLHTLLGGSAVAPQPAWSPDGRYLAFVASDTGSTFNIGYPAQSQITSQIFVVNANGSNIEQVTQGSGNKSHPSWSPDGEHIAFSGYDANFDLDIYVVDKNGANLTNLTHPFESNEDYPVWSPDGSQIAFQALLNNNWELFSMNADGSNMLQLTFSSGQENISNVQASWSPDGKRIVFASNRSGAWDIYVMNRDGAKVKALTQDGASDMTPDWSPDGRLIAFSSNRDGRFQIYIMEIDGSEVRLPTRKLENLNSDEPDWRPSEP